MRSGVEGLIDFASEALASLQAVVDSGPIMSQLGGEIWSRRNGFYAFDSALLVRPFSSPCLPLGVVEWNDPSGWKKKFDTDLSSDVFFAEDVFGEQFSLRDSGVFKFRPETGETELFARDLHSWADAILGDNALHTGQPLAREWQNQNGALPRGYRLAPKLPFVVGGEYATSNLTSMRDSELIEYSAQIANQIANLSDGSQIRITMSN